MELLIAVMLLGTVVVTLLGAFGTLIKTSNVGRRTTDAANVLTAAAQELADNERTAFQTACPASYTSSTATSDDTSITVESVRYWDGSKFTSTCESAEAQAYRLQLLVVRVHTAVTDRTVEVVKRG